MEVTLSGMVTEVSDVQPEKVDLPIEVTLFPRVTDSRFEQPWKAEEPIEVTLSGMVISVSDEWLLKAPLRMEVTFIFPMYSGIYAIVIDLSQPKRVPSGMIDRYG